MITQKIKYASFWLLLFLLTGCDLLKPDDVINPNVDEDTFLHTDNAMQTWVNGTEKEFALHISDYVELMEILSDNYFNNYSRSSKEFDRPRLLYTDADVTNLQRYVGTMREMADYGLTKVAALDQRTTDSDRFRLLVVKAYSYLLAGEFFRALPVGNGVGVSEWPEQLRFAMVVLDEALDLATDAEDQSFVHTLYARAAYRLGDRVMAKTHAQQALALSGDLCRQVLFDGDNDVLNNAQTAIWGTWFQPLPRLDFLDPKYFETYSTEQRPITIAKAEENYLILAEAAAAENDLSEVRRQLSLLLQLVAERPVQTALNDQLEGRYNGGYKHYPSDPSFQVQASPSDPLRSGLIIDRRAPQLITIPYISGTSVTPDMVTALTTHDEALEMIYLMRQEIFFAEGRRPADLGIRLPICEVEAAATTGASAYTEAQIPSFIPLDQGMDAFTIDDENKTVTILYNMNRIIVENAASKEVVPFE